jgi:hypothetical protein
MQQTDVPLAVRIMPRRAVLWAGLGAGLASAALLGWLAAHARAGPLSIGLCWVALGLCALIAIRSAVRLLIQLPLIEVSEVGIAVWLHGPYRRPFFAPWSRVRAVALTRVRNADAAPGAATREALGIELIPDQRLQQPLNDELPIDGAPRADLAWSNRSISGDPRHWVELLQRMKSIYAEPQE